jgi:hypothetical protein
MTSASGKLRGSEFEGSDAIRPHLGRETMDDDQFADEYLSKVPTILNDDTLIIDGPKAQSMIRSYRQQAIAFFENHLAALVDLSAQRSQIVENRKLLALYDQLLFQIAFFFESEEQNGSYRERLTTTMIRLCQHLPD